MNDSPDEFWIQRSERLTLVAERRRKDVSEAGVGRRTRYTSLDSDRVVFMKYPWVSGNRQMVHSLANSNETDPVNEVASFSLLEFVRCSLKRCSFRLDDGNLLTLS